MIPMPRWILIFLLCCPLWAHAVEIREFTDPAQQQRYEHLIDDLRCLVCQNQSLADSDADLAKDLRDEVYQIIRSGKNEEEAIKFLTDRYGDFVLYRPPFKPVTVFLWAGPFLLLLVGGWVLLSHARRRGASTREPVLSEADKARLEQLQKRQ